jgi:hypothetical protein
MAACRCGSTLCRVTRPFHVPGPGPVVADGEPTGHPEAGAASGAPRPLAALVDVQPATRSLVSVWLAEHRWEVAELDRLPRAPDALIVEVSFPRTAPPPALPTLAARFPGVPAVMVSPTLVAGTPSRGEVARQLGVAAVLGMPLSRTHLLATLRELTGRGG